MYDELVKSLRMCEDGEKCNLCTKWLDKQNGGLNACQAILSKEAADAIEELQKQRDEWESHAALAESFAQGWIPVTERLPDFDEVVQITDGINVGHGYLAGVCSSTGYVACMWDSPFCDIDEEHITHWMPLPEPPKDGEE